MDLLGGLSDLHKSAESFDPMSLTNTMGSVTSGVGGAMGGLTDAVGLVVPNPLDILNEEKDINELPTAEAADIIWERMRDYMKEKGEQRAVGLFKVKFGESVSSPDAIAALAYLLCFFACEGN